VIGFGCRRSPGNGIILERDSSPFIPPNELLPCSLTTIDYRSFEWNRSKPARVR